MYTFDSRVRYSETGEDGLLSLAGDRGLFSGCFDVSVGGSRSWH